MLSVRLTLLKPRSDAEEEMLEALQELNDHLAAAPGLLLSMVLRNERSLHERALGRLAVWESDEAANREATSHRVLALRARIRLLSDEIIAEDLLQTEPSWATGTDGLYRKGEHAIIDQAAHREALAG